MYVYWGPHISAPCSCMLNIRPALVSKRPEMSKSCSQALNCAPRKYCCTLLVWTWSRQSNLLPFMWPNQRWSAGCCFLVLCPIFSCCCFVTNEGRTKKMKSSEASLVFLNLMFMHFNFKILHCKFLYNLISECVVNPGCEILIVDHFWSSTCRQILFMNTAPVFYWTKWEYR